MDIYMSVMLKMIQMTFPTLIYLRGDKTAQKYASDYYRPLYSINMILTNVL